MKNSSAAAMVWPYSREPNISRVSRKAPAPAATTSQAALSKPVPNPIAATMASAAAVSRRVGRNQCRTVLTSRAARPRAAGAVVPVAAKRRA